jgi:hypothetical protein
LTGKQVLSSSTVTNVEATTQNNITIDTDSTTFTIESKFITDNIEDICFKISFGGVVANYTMSSGEVELSKGSESVTAKVNWMNHTKLLRDGGDATVKVYMKISNGLVYGFDFTMNKNTSVM